MKAKKTGRAAIIFLIVFALPFAGVGTFAGYLAGSTLTTWVRAQSWDQVPATLLSVNLDVNTGGDSTTYRVEALYEYNYLGRTYTSDTVSSSFGADNIGSFHQDKYAELRRYLDAGERFRCFVNPADPSEAMLYREMRWGIFAFEIIFALVFGGVGYGLMFAAVYGGRLVKEAEELKAARPEHPWLWEKDWVDGHIRAGSKGKMIGALVFATLWNLISAPALFFVPDEVAGGNKLAFIALLFPVIGMGLAGWAVYTVLQWRKFGNSEFEIFSNPGVLGGCLEGRIHTNIRHRPDDGFALTLSCIRKVTTGSGDSRSTSEKVLWQDSFDIPANTLLTGPHGASVPVRFVIPYDAGPATDTEADDPVEWRLEVAAELPGVDYSTHFTVPVFRTPESDPDLEAEIHEAAAGSRRDPVERLRDAGIVRRPTPSGGVVYVFTRARAKGVAIGLTLFMIIWFAIIWGMIDFGAPIFFPSMFGLVALPFVFFIFVLWLKETRVEISGGNLTFTKRMVPSGKTVTFRAVDVVSIKTKGGMQAGNRLYYQIILKTRAGKEHTLAAQLGDQRLAKLLVKDFEAALAT
ncbi:MAG: DUF3592 domain-containing protein [Acidobacteria bacterium]|nr:DUF3592 domain-containing protein [Acidobacteriota bacterium]